MTYLLLAVLLLLCAVNTPRPVGAAASVSSTINLNPGETFANAWASAGSTPRTDPPCGTNGVGVKSSTGSKVECPTGASAGTNKSATDVNGDKASARAWAQISGGIGSANAPVNIPIKPKSFAGAAAYAKANSSVPSTAKGAGKVGGLFTITKGNLTLTGWSEPADNIIFIQLDDLPENKLPDVLANVLDVNSIKFLKDEGFTFANAEKVYYSITMVLQGKKGAKVKLGKPTFFTPNMPKCPDNFKMTFQELQNLQESKELQESPELQAKFEKRLKEFPACLISEHSLSEKDFTPCKDAECVTDELRHSLTSDSTVEFFIPGRDLSENISLHEISCVKSRRPIEPLPKDRDICSLSLAVPRLQGSGQSRSN